MTAAAAMKRRAAAAAGALRAVAALAFVLMASPPAREVSAGKKCVATRFHSDLEATLDHSN